MEFRTYFVYFHTVSCKFKVQRTPTEFGRPVVKPVKAAHIEDTLSLLLNWLRTPCVAVGLKIIKLFFFSICKTMEVK